MTNLKSTIVLVHGGIVDGSGWEGLYRILKNDGYEVSIVPAAQRFMSKRAGATAGKPCDLRIAARGR